MQHLKLFSTAFLSGLILIAYSGTTVDKTTTAANSDPSGTGKDMFYEYKLTTSSKEMSIQSDTKMYISSKGDMRMEMNTTTSFKGKNTSVPLVTIGHLDKPNESISIDDEKKTYTITHINRADLNRGKIQSTATKVGEEKILGFNSVHAQIISNKSIGSFYSAVDTVDLWRSNDVPLLASVKELMDKVNSAGMALFSADVANQLKQMGCVGFMTKMEIHSKNSSVTEVLVKAEHRNLADNLFQIPAGYKEDKSGM